MNISRIISLLCGTKLPYLLGSRDVTMNSINCMFIYLNMLHLMSKTEKIEATFGWMPSSGMCFLYEVAEAT